MKRANKLEAMIWTLAMITGSVAGGACTADIGDNEPEGIESAEQAWITTNGWSNRLSLNGAGENGAGENGKQLSGVSLASLRINGISQQGVQLQGAELVSVRSDNGAVVRGEELEGATMTGVLTNGSSIELAIEAVNASNDPGILEYTVRALVGSSWTSLCGETADGQPITAIPLSGRWDFSSGTATGGDYIEDPSLFTFACDGAVLAKCVKLGYKPWETIEECDGSSCQEVSKRPLHQACTRMMRADYCGDSAPHTRDGTPINIWDNFGVQEPEAADGNWKRDAEWSPDGAVCIKSFRYNNGASDYVDAFCPEKRSASFECFGKASTFFTASGFDVAPEERSLLRNEFLHDYTKNY
jgi:hypothetical protein